MHWLSMLSTGVTLAFAVAVLDRYRRKGGWHLLWAGFGVVRFRHPF